MSAWCVLRSIRRLVKTAAEAEASAERQNFFNPVERDPFSRVISFGITAGRMAAMSGLLALLDDVAAIAKVAAASVDDIAAAAGKAGSKAAGIIIDDAAVTPKYVA